MDDLNIWIIIAQVLNFLLLLLLFYKFLWKTIVKIIEERRKTINDIESSDNLAKEKLEKAEKEAEDIILKWKEEALKIQKDTEELTKKESFKKMMEAQKKADSLVKEAERSIEQERLSMVNWLKEKIVSVSLLLNSKIFENSSKNKEFIEKELESIKI